MTRRALFTRLLSAIGAIPLVGRVVRERWTPEEIRDAVGCLEPPRMNFELAKINERDFRCPFKLVKRDD